ncbi:MAG: threonine aldolase family protein [Longimicrobiales bacterium]
MTRPTPGMRQALANAIVGDDALGDDPTVQQLEERVAALLGKPASLFLPSGIMGNQIAVHLLARRATEVVLDATAHILDWEDGAAAAWSGVQLRAAAGVGGLLDAPAVRAAIREPSVYRPATTLVCIENTHNASGGRVLPLKTMREIRAVAAEHGLPVHLDGARLWNAAAASAVAERDFAACADTVMVTLSKGLGCPVGSMLAGEQDVIERARRLRRRFGGTLRQAGILAAAALYALDHHRQRLTEDHTRAKRLAASVARVADLDIPVPETNIVMIELHDRSADSSTIAERARAAGVLVSEFGRRRIRLVTHLDIDDAAIERATEVLGRLLQAA